MPDGAPSPDADPDPDSDPGPDPDPDPPAPTTLTLGDPLAAEEELVADGEFVAVFAWPHGWLAEDAAGVRLSDPAGDRGLDGPSGVTAAAPFGGGVLVASATGLWFAGDAGVALSPLDDELPGVTGLAADGDRLWLAGASGLHLWQDGAVLAVRPEGLSTADARIAVSGGVLWVASGGVLWRLWEDDGWQAERVVDELAEASLAAAESGAAWVSAATGLRLAGPTALTEYSAPEHAGVTARGGDVWLFGPGLHLTDGRGVRPIEVGPIRAAAALGGGAVLVATGDRLARVTVGAPPEPDLPTWSGDIVPLFEAACAVCHGERGNARRLDDIASFSEQVDLIVVAVREGRMPLPPNEPLSDTEIAMIEAWKDAEFPE